MEFIQDLALEFVKLVISKKNNDIAWKKLFEESGQFIKDFAKGSESFNNVLCSSFSEENMRALSRRIKINDGSELVKELQDGIKKIINDYDFTNNEKDYIISGFIQIVLQWVKENKSDIYTQYLLKDNTDKIVKKLDEISNSVRILPELLNRLAVNHIHAYSIEQIEEELRGNTKNPIISLDFFTIDDENFIRRFEENLAKIEASGQIYVKGRSKEETTYCILNQIKEGNYNRNTIIVRNKKEWELLGQDIRNGKKLVEGAIAIPFFYAQQIDPLKGNITIFIYDAEDAIGSKTVLELKPRTQKTIREALERAGLNGSDSYELVQETHGLYALLKKRIFTSQFLSKPEWIKINEDWLVRVLMCGQWTNIEEDTYAIETLTEIPYKVLEKKIELLMKGDEPFLINYTKHGRHYYRIACYENVWGYIGDRVNIKDDFWRRYSTYVIDALTNENMIRRLFNKNDSASSTKPNDSTRSKVECSDELKEGMLKSLIFVASYRQNRRDYQQAVDNIVSGIMDTIHDRNLWCDIAPFFIQLCEASPEAVLKKVEKEFESSTGFLDFFSKEKTFLGQSRYTQLIFGLEQLLVQKRYAFRALRVFAKLNSLQMNYAYINSPEETLSNAFCPWMNLTAIPQNKKAEVLEVFVRDYPECWTIAYSGLPNRKTMISGDFWKPKFRDYSDIYMPEWNDVFKTQLEYWDICVKYAQNDVGRWMKLIEEAVEFDKEKIETFFATLSNEIQKNSNMDENCGINEFAKAKIKNTIRQTIYRHRFFKSAIWAMGEEKLAVYRKAFDEIELMVPEYEYLYLGQSEFSFPLLNPNPFDMDDYQTLNRQLMNLELESQFKHFLEKKLDIFIFLMACYELGYQKTELGEKLFLFYTDESFDEELFRKLLSDKSHYGVAIGYATSAVSKDQKILLGIIELVETYINDECEAVGYYLIAPLDSELLDRISNKSIKFKKLYWSRYSHSVLAGDLRTRVLEELYSYGTIASVLRFLWYHRKTYDSSKMLGLLIRMFKEGLSEPDATSKSILEDLLEIVQSSYTDRLNKHIISNLSSEDKIENDKVDVADYDAGRLIDLEIASYFCGLISWDQMRCLKTELEHNPDYYVQLLDELFLKDSQKDSYVNGYNQKENSDEQKNKAKIVYSLYSDMAFCPGVCGGNVDADLLKQWVERFRNGMIQSDHMSKFTMCLGKLFAYSPKGLDGYHPEIPIREMIEKYGDDKLENAYVSCIFNQRGVYALSAGKEEKKLSEEYKSAADYFTMWPKTGKIYYRLSDIYEDASREDRDVAVYEE